MKKLTIFVNSRCNKDGLGAYCIIARHPGRTMHSETGCLSGTTQMGTELFSMVSALEYVRQNSYDGRSFTVVMDSSYVFKGVTQWLENWIANDWRSSDNKEIKNVEFWQKLAALIARFNITWELVNSKHDHPQFVKADVIALSALEDYVADLKAEAEILQSGVIGVIETTTVITDKVPEQQNVETTE